MAGGRDGWYSTFTKSRMCHVITLGIFLFYEITIMHSCIPLCSASHRFLYFIVELSKR